MYNIIIDAMGGDNGPSVVVEGVKKALTESEGFTVTLVGRENEIIPHIDSDFKDKIKVINANDIIEMCESPVNAIRTKKDSSMVVGLNLLKNGEGDAFISSGSTGALITGATLIVRRAKNVERAALSPLLPNLKGTWTQLIDCGANVDSKASYIKQFAVMGSVYMNKIEGIEAPKVGLLNNGTEEEKGCALTKEAYQLLKEAEGINFVGNIEARDALSGECDVLVCDGFTGNILMKSIEGTVGALMKMLKSELLSTTISKIGAGLSKKAFMNVKKKMDYREYGGALLLGIKAPVVKAHGSSNDTAYKNAILQTKKFLDNNVVSGIEEGLAGDGQLAD